MAYGLKYGDGVSPELAMDLFNGAEDKSKMSKNLVLAQQELANRSISMQEQSLALKKKWGEIELRRTARRDRIAEETTYLQHEAMRQQLRTSADANTRANIAQSSNIARQRRMDDYTIGRNNRADKINMANARKNSVIAQRNAVFKQGNERRKAKDALRKEENDLLQKGGRLLKRGEPVEGARYTDSGGRVWSVPTGGTGYSEKNKRARQDAGSSLSNVTSRIKILEKRIEDAKYIVEDDKTRGGLVKPADASKHIANLANLQKEFDDLNSRSKRLTASIKGLRGGNDNALDWQEHKNQVNNLFVDRVVWDGESKLIKNKLDGILAKDNGNKNDIGKIDKLLNRLEVVDNLEEDIEDVTSRAYNPTTERLASEINGLFKTAKTDDAVWWKDVLENVYDDDILYNYFSSRKFKNDVAKRTTVGLLNALNGKNPAVYAKAQEILQKAYIADKQKLWAKNLKSSRKK
jgi:hypothetical protein